MKYANNITELIGNTPLVKLQGASNASGATVLGKCEFMNPSHSVKDRIGTNMINAAIKAGLITKDTTVIEPTSGNTGIALEDDIKIVDVKADNPILNIFFDESKNSMKKIFDVTLDNLDEYQEKYNEFLHYSI